MLSIGERKVTSREGGVEGKKKKMKVLLFKRLPRRW